MEMETKRERKSSEAPPSSPRSEAMSLLGEDSEYAGLSSTTSPGELRRDENTRSAKKRKQGDEDEDENPFPPRDSYYLGSICVDNAWSTITLLRKVDFLFDEADTRTQEYIYRRLGMK